MSKKVEVGDIVKYKNDYCKVQFIQGVKFWGYWTSNLQKCRDTTLIKGINYENKPEGMQYISGNRRLFEKDKSNISWREKIENIKR